MDQIQEFIYARVNALINEGITKCPPIQTALPSHVKGAPLTLSCSLSPRWGSKGVRGVGHDVGTCMNLTSKPGHQVSRVSTPPCQTGAGGLPVHRRTRGIQSY